MKEADNLEFLQKSPKRRDSYQNLLHI